ncbi:hypothetical protein HBI52_243140 [Parastagonospora nodorum]|nr:hypothetical protein HBI52_243140 [Parastagonospora nodorum]
MNLALLLNLQEARKRGNVDCVNNNNNNIIPTLQFSLTALLNLQLLALKRSILSDSDLNCRRTNPTIAYTVPYPNLKKYLGNSTGNNHNNLNIMVTNPTSREFSRVNIKLLTRLSNVANVFDIVISKLDEVPTQELSSYIKIELLRDNSRKFYRLVITSEDTHYKQIIKKAYIMLLERALLILFMT